MSPTTFGDFCTKQISMLRSLQVSEETHRMYTEGGKAEKAKLLKMFIESGFDKASFEMLNRIQSNLTKSC